VLIRTILLELSRLQTVAYRQKLKHGNSGAVILRTTCHTPPELFPMEAFQEALSLTSGIPRARRGRVKLSQTSKSVADDPASGSPEGTDAEASPEDLGTVCSVDCAAIVKAYTNKKGELSYELLNKALIKAAHGNPFVAETEVAGASLEEIRDHTMEANYEAMTGNRSLGPVDVQRIVAMVNKVSPRSHGRPPESHARITHAEEEHLASPARIEINKSAKEINPR
jgi:hypothetical protein